MLIKTGYTEHDEKSSQLSPIHSDRLMTIFSASLDQGIHQGTISFREGYEGVMKEHLKQLLRDSIASTALLGHKMVSLPGDIPSGVNHSANSSELRTWLSPGSSKTLPIVDWDIPLKSKEGQTSLSRTQETEGATQGLDHPTSTEWVNPNALQSERLKTSSNPFTISPEREFALDQISLTIHDTPTETQREERGWSRDSMDVLDNNAAHEGSGSTDERASPQPTVDSNRLNAFIVCSKCEKRFTRKGDLRRHEASTHGLAPAIYNCPIPRCPKSTGPGYSRLDKLREHLWKKHGDLGYTKRA
jgi:hypothetical protein